MWGHALIFSLIPLIGLGKVMSMDMCADRFVLHHYDKGDILATTYLSKAPTRHHTGTTEEILALNPSLVISEFPLPSKQHDYLKTRGISFKILPALHTLDDLYKRFPKASPINFPAIGLGRRVLILTQNLHTPGAKTFWDDVLKTLGFINLSCVAGIKGWGYLSTEKILALKPDLLIVFGKRTTVPMCLMSMPMKYIADDDYLCPSPDGVQRMIEALK
jgi:ABC-type Fe3+-hydroxamate transport system substrate-binding protein